MAEDEKFISRWARRKAENAAGTLAEDEAPGVEPDIQPDAQAALSENDEALLEDPDDHPAAGIDIDTLDAQSDFTVFMHEKVPQAIRRRALRQLWASNPIFAHLDGLNDYDDDFTDAATVVEGLKAAYDEARARLKAEEDAAAETPGDGEADEEAPADAEPAVAQGPDPDDDGNQAETGAETDEEDLEDGTDEA